MATDTARLIALMEHPAWLMTGEDWTKKKLEGQIALLVDVGQDLDTIGADIFEALPEHTKTWIQGWQEQINDGSCWHTQGNIGRQAAHLLESGHCLLSPRRVTDYYGSVICSRDDIAAGRPGSADYVRAKMGQAYLDWIRSI